MWGNFRQLLKDNAGATAIEYGLMAALLGVALIGAFKSFGQQMDSTFYVASNAMGSAS